MSKDQPFVPSTTYIGFIWNLELCTVSLSPNKTDKYIDEINKWVSQRAHTFKHMQELYGKLLHVSSILPQGHMYLVGLESMLATGVKQPFISHRPDNSLEKDLQWWTEKLCSGTIVWAIYTPPSYLDPRAFSDVSSSVGIGITVGNRWRAWRLPTGWQSLHGPKDIGWAKAVAFELLICTLDTILPNSVHVLLHSDNTGVVEGWRTGRHCNRAVNTIFKHIHTFLDSAIRICSVATCYIPSGDNPANKSSRGIYSSENLLLPTILTSEHLRDFLTDATNPLSARELRNLRDGKYSISATRVLNNQCTRQEAVERTRAETQLEDELVLQILQSE
jgi:hypothetical protein